VYLRNGAEHTATFYVDDDEVGSIPVFVEAADGGDPGVAAEETFKKAVAKGSVVWLTVPQPQGKGRKGRVADHTQPVWFVADGTTLYVLDGPSEQQVPNLTAVEEVQISARSKDLRAKISDVRAAVEIIPKDDEQWEKTARTGLGRRLNLPDGDAAMDRWRAQCTMVKLTPRFRDEEADVGGAPAAAAAAAPTAAGDAAAEQPKKKAEEDIHVDVEIDQAVFDKLVAEGTSERVARAKAKAAYVRAEKKRIRAEQAAAAGEGGEGGEDAA
jgi:hypothetical protein